MSGYAIKHSALCFIIIQRKIDSNDHMWTMEVWAELLKSWLALILG